MAKDDADRVAEARGSSRASSSAVVPTEADKERTAATTAANKKKADRLKAAKENPNKLVKMRAKVQISLPRATAEELKIVREVKAGQTVEVPPVIAEMFCAPLVGSYSDEGGEWSGRNRKKHQTIRAEIVS